MSRPFILVIIFLFTFTVSQGQVSEILSASASRSSKGSSDSGSSSDFMIDFAFEFIGGLTQMQKEKLGKRHEIPGLISVDLMLQAAVQPSSYYIIDPRVRANWGLFSTDFRFNYILEEDIDGFRYLRTSDWQIIQLNLITTRDVCVRVGGGMIYEAYEEKSKYTEWTIGFQMRPVVRKLGGMAEYRWSEARTEVGAHLQYAIFNTRRLHGYFTGGVVFQRYFSTVSIWGVQGGFIFSAF